MKSIKGLSAWDMGGACAVVSGRLFPTAIYIYTPNNRNLPHRRFLSRSGTF